MIEQRSSIFLALLYVLYTVLAEPLKGTDDQIIVFACQSALAKHKFGCDDSYWQCACQYDPLLESIILCIDEYYPDQQKQRTDFSYLQTSCSKYADVEISIEEIDQQRTNGTNFLKPADGGEFNSTDILFEPIVPIKGDVVPKFKDYRAFLGNFDLAQYYGLLIILYWALILLCFGVLNRIKKYSLNNKVIGKRINWLRKKFSLSMIGKNHFQPYTLVAVPKLLSLTSLIPSGPEGYVLLVYFALHSYFLLGSYKVYPGNSIFGDDVLRQLLRYIADRSGILAFAHFPILILFAGRNNLLISASQLPYSTFMVFHKWTARIMFVDSLIHSLAYFRIIVDRIDWEVYVQSQVYLQWGALALVICITILFQAIHNFRVNCYEIFLVVHVILAIVFFIACWYHCVRFGWLDWIIGSMSIWILDRVIRIYRLYKFGCPEAKLEFISDDTFKVSVKRPAQWKPFPGCFVFAYFFHWSIFWQSHPFTIVDSVSNDQEITIYIKSKDGATRKLRSIIGDAPYAVMKISLEGPYGIQAPLENYDSVFLIAGGNGIPGPFYHALDLAKKSQNSKQRIKLIWAIRKIESLKWFEKELIKLERFRIECDIYITRDNIADSDDYLLTELKNFTNVFSGRADIAKILTEEFENSVGSMAIVTCGNPIMCDDVRLFVSENLNLSNHRIDLFEELQVW